MQPNMQACFDPSWPVVARREEPVVTRRRPSGPSGPSPPVGPVAARRRGPLWMGKCRLQTTVANVCGSAGG